VVCRDHLYPDVRGGDIGCGIALFDPGLPRRKFRLDRAVKRLSELKSLSDIEIEADFEEPCPIRDFGSIGGGNHFAEFQVIQEAADQKAAEELGLTEGQVLLLIHTGSRGFGQTILEAFNRETGYESSDPQYRDYLERHREALIWAARNRRGAAAKIQDYLNLGSSLRLVSDQPHNFVENHEGLLYHRKGAVSALNGPAVIAGSRGAFSYLVQPLPSELSGYSVSHGAGRKWARSMCRERLSKKKSRNDLSRTDLGSWVVCQDTELLYQEAPQAYKNIEDVINVLSEHSLIKVLAVLKPVLTYKG
jgi:release factor H-coupled RctB family protein